MPLALPAAVTSGPTITANIQDDRLRSTKSYLELMMFKLFKTDPKKMLEVQYARKLEEARDAQRSGKIPLFATLSAEAEEIGQRLDALQQGG